MIVHYSLIAQKEQFVWFFFFFGNFGQGVAESYCHPDEGLRQFACLAAFHWRDFREGLIYSRYYSNCFKNTLTIEQFSLLGNELTSVNIFCL